jgi:hypothetical protein
MNVRTAASTTAAVKGLAANHAKAIVECYVQADSVSATFGSRPRPAFDLEKAELALGVPPSCASW